MNTHIVTKNNSTLLSSFCYYRQAEVVHDNIAQTTCCIIKGLKRNGKDSARDLFYMRHGVNVKLKLTLLSF